MLTNEQVKVAADFFIREIARLAENRSIRIMEVCGSHTVAIFKAGIRQLLPKTVDLLSGPGCPVCVTPNDFLDRAIAYSKQPEVIITTFGDMLKVPGSSSSLAQEKARGGDIRIVYSPVESLEIATANPKKKVIFLAVGFETTAPLAAATVLMAEQRQIRNFYVLSAHKLVPPALRILLQADRPSVDGFLLPGHVSAMIGMKPYEFLVHDYHTPAVIAGFEPLDILQSIYLLMKQIQEKEPKLENQYGRVVPAAGNEVACQMLYQVYQRTDTNWRGIGVLKDSGLVLREQYRAFDATENIPVNVEAIKEHAGCRCGEVLTGSLLPKECPLFGKVCKPEHPVGSCMVSVEGTCAAWYKYGAGRWQG